MYFAGAECQRSRSVMIGTGGAAPFGGRCPAFDRDDAEFDLRRLDAGERGVGSYDRCLTLFPRDSGAARWLLEPQPEREAYSSAWKAGAE